VKKDEEEIRFNREITHYTFSSGDLVLPHQKEDYKVGT
jgi:hypothetical protein